MNGAKRIIVEYGDGVRREADFEKLSKQGQVELSVLGLCEAPLPETGKKYALFRWKDGWNEVLAVNEKAKEVLRFYSIERMEDIGRFSLEIEGGNPDLYIVKRNPDQVKEILLVGSENNTQSYVMEEKATIREGGKVEHFYYDKTKPNFKREDASAASESYDAIVNAVEGELKKAGLDASELLAKDEDERAKTYKALSRALSLYGMQSQQDVYGFIQIAIEKLAAGVEDIY
ncbi:hypothetical protein SAMN04489760_104119 [Syntrophus gentianae]|uniref:Uncharacterized protein n=1 Tax=Syntrophus gentianae TaxID=43775 RepID=A0A1H7VR96_9BACT|nr:hypothetical protein [Syntrophus gentianae]SEM11365.1 hypothetical protein SAMN04489760_104119 [Syntrophus gentianae]